MTTLLHRTRHAVRRLGSGLARHRPAGGELARLLQRYAIDVVVDVGAHRGDYGAMLREAEYRGRIVSFEPLRASRNELRRRASYDKSWIVLPYALGDLRGTATLHIAGGSGAHSSLLPMLPQHWAAAPGTACTGEVTVETRRLDELWSCVAGPDERVFLNLTVQGYEAHVLRGIGQYTGNCHGLQVQASLLPLYEGAPLFDEVLTTARDVLGMTLMSLTPRFSDPRDGRLLQCDLVLFQEDGTTDTEGASTPTTERVAQ